MILYHVSTMYHLLRCIVHKLAYYPEEECRLLIVEYILTKREKVEPMVEWIREQNWFTRVDIVPEREFKLKRNTALTEKSTAKEIEALADRISCSVEKWFQDDISRYDRIYVAADHWSFGIYLLCRKIPYVFWEDASGMLSEEQRYFRIIKNVNLTNYVISEYYKGAGRSDLVTQKLCDIENQQPGFYDPKAVHFSVYDTLKEKIPDQIEHILNFYMVSPIEVQGNACLFLTQYAKTLTIKEIYVQELLTALLIDYVCPEHTIIVKPHPKDHYIDYRRLLGNSCVVLPNEFPSEILPFLIRGKIDMVLTASSTSIGGMKRYVQRTYSFGTRVEAHWEDLHQMEAAVLLLREMGIRRTGLERIDTLQMNNLLEVSGMEIGGSEAVIDGGLGKVAEERDRSAASVVILLDLEKRACYPNFPRQELARMIVSVRPDYRSNLKRKDYTFFVHCRDPQKLKQVLRFRYTRRLEASKATVQISTAVVTEEKERYLLAREKAEKEWRNRHE